ncbi:PhoU domain-containing protein [Ilumatobacter sp.]|uniref:PhoU domain-containing protein n=1 Tax=Ilumatobacter sp. TaxID=1967498 RepID=UPI003AF47275
MSFFRKSESPLEQISNQTISMLGDARHSFDLASTVILSGADSKAVGADIDATDRRINEAEQKLRSELVVHVSVRGGGDIGLVLGYTLLLKKIERIGDQARNIFDLAADGVSLAGSDDIDEFVARRQEISLMYVEAADLLQSQDEAAAKEFLARSLALNDACGAKVLEYMHTDQPGSWAVPRAILYRYWKRIVANLAGIVTAAIEPLQNIDYLDDGKTDITDD